MISRHIQPLLNKNYTKAISAKGVYIYDEKGRKYLDGSSGAMTCSLGHSHEKIIPFLKTQLDKLQYVYRSQFGSHEAESLAESLWKISPEKAFDYSFFVNSGSEAIETAMKIAIQYWQEMGFPGKQRFITRWKSYHGITLGALSLSGHPARRARFENSLHKFASLKSDLETSTIHEQETEFIRTIENIGPENIAAFVAEPIVGAAGTAISPPPGYYEMIRKVCDRNRILFIADEVLTGLGRTGHWFALEHWSTKADIIVLGKSLGAGYAPVAAAMMTSKILEPTKNGSGLIMSGHSYSGNPFSCATAGKVIEIIREDDLISNANTMGNWLLSELNLLKNEYGFICKVRGKGLLLGLEFDPDMIGLQSKCVDQCFENGLLVYPSAGGISGTVENGILIAPPFIITQSQAEELISKLKKSFDEINAYS